MQGTVLFIALLSARLALAADLANSPAPALGDRLFRDGRFAEARGAYQRAFEADPGAVAAQLGLGKIAEVMSSKDESRSYYSRAFQRNPANPEAILAFASLVGGKARETLLRNFLALRPSTDPRAADVAGRLEMEGRLAGRAVGVVEDPRRSYRLSLAEVRTDGHPRGLTMAVRVNGGPALNLLLDSGATGIVLGPAAGTALELELLARMELFGFGSSEGAAGEIALARTVETGDLRIANVLVHVTHKTIAPQVDGLIGLDVFHDFLIRVDARAGRLELEPFVDGACANCTQAYRLGHLLLVPAKINGGPEGNFILDTGSAINLVSAQMAPSGNRTAQLLGSQGMQEVALRSAPLSFQIGSQGFLSFDCGTLDTAGLSERHGTAIAGAIGYALIRDTTLTVDYRRGKINLAKRR